MLNKIKDFFNVKENVTLLKIDYQENSIKTMIHPNLNMLPLPHKEQIKAFIEQIKKDMGGK